MNTNRHKDRWTSFNDNWRQNTSALLSRWCDPVMGGSPHPGARASRPHKSSRSFSHLLHRNQPAAAPCLCFGRAHAVPAGRAVGCNIAGKLSGNPRDSMRAGRPRSRGCRPDGEVGGIRRATSLKAGLSPLGNSRLPASRALAPGPGGSFEGETTSPYAYQEQGPCPVKPVFYILNMDTQDRQDNQDEKLLHKKLIGSIIECAFVENLSVLRGPPRTPFESFPTPWNPFADPLPDLWQAPLEPPPTPSWPFAVLRGPSWICFCLFLGIFSPFPTFGGSLLSLLQPLRGPSPFFVALRGYLFAFSWKSFPLGDLWRIPLELSPTP